MRPASAGISTGLNPKHRAPPCRCTLKQSWVTSTGVPGPRPDLRQRPETDRGGVVEGGNGETARPGCHVSRSAVGRGRSPRPSGSDHRPCELTRSPPANDRPTQPQDRVVQDLNSIPNCWVQYLISISGQRALLFGIQQRHKDEALSPSAARQALNQIELAAQIDREMPCGCRWRGAVAASMTAS